MTGDVKNFKTLQICPAAIAHIWKAGNIDYKSKRFYLLPISQHPVTYFILPHATKQTPTQTRPANEAQVHTAQKHTI